MKNTYCRAWRKLGVPLLAAVLGLAGCATGTPDKQAGVRPQIGEPELRCKDWPDAPDDKIAAMLGLDLERLDNLRKVRYLSNRDICSMPTKALLRSLAKFETPKPAYPGEWAAFRAMRQADEFGVVKPDGLITGIQQRQQIVADHAAALAGGTASDTVAGISSSGWNWIGPGNIGGRIRSILTHPTNASKIWIGSVSGGIWVSNDGGASWGPVNDFMGNLAVSTLAMDPLNSSVMYAGTGEGFYNSDAVRGAGIFKSTDGGVTWNQMTSTNPLTGGDQWYYVNRLAIHPTNSQIILAATRSGLYRSSNGGASWTLVATGGNNGALDVRFNPNDGNNAIVAFNTGTIAYSTNAGANWTSVVLTAGLDFYGRVEVAYARSTSGTAYAAVGASELCTSCAYLYKTTNGGASWTYVSSPNHLGSQSWYDNAIWVDPTNSSHLIVGGIDLWRSTNGGVNFTKISQWYSSPLSAHADHHAIVSSAAYDGGANRTIYFGNDGGIYKVQDITTVGLTTNWTVLNNGLGITQFYGGAGKAAAGAGRIVGGTQDNGDLKYSGAGTNWSAYYGGDGGYSAADSANDNYLYGEYVYLEIHRSTDGGVSTSVICNGSGGASRITEGSCASPQNSSANFISPFVLDPNNNNRMLAGAKSLWVSNNVKATYPSWTVFKSPAVSQSKISAIAVAEGNSNITWVGHNSGEVYMTTNGGSTWTKMSGLPARMVLRILIDKSNTNRVYVSFGGFASDNLKLTTDGGATWSTISGSLPAVPIGSIVRHPSNANWLYAGTEVGVFSSEDGGATWNTSNDGPANVAVDELFWYDNQRLVAATHGRGMFMTTLGGGAPGAPTIISMVAGAGKVTITFSPPSSNGGSAITSYTARCAATGYPTKTATGAGSPLVVTGLTGGVAYSCSVFATNGSGTSGASSVAQTVTPKALALVQLLMMLLD